MKRIILAAAAAALILCGCNSGEGGFTTTAATDEIVDLRSEAPNFVGLKLEQVEMRYPSLNIVTEYKSDSSEKDTVIAQDIAAGEKYNDGATFTLTLSSGPKLVELDDYTSRNIDEAQELIEKQGFLCDIIRTESDSIPENCIVKTDPAAREKVLPGSTIICYVSMGAPETEIVVPNLINLSVEEASQLAADNHIGLTIAYENDPEAVPGTVLKQSIEEGTVVEPDTRVEITIAGEASATAGKSNITVAIANRLEGEFQFKYYIDGTLQEEKTEIKELSLTKKISWDVSGKDVHTYSIVVTSMETGKSGILFEMEVDYTQDPPTQDHHDTYNENLFEELITPDSE